MIKGSKIRFIRDNLVDKKVHIKQSDFISVDIQSLTMKISNQLYHVFAKEKLISFYSEDITNIALSEGALNMKEVRL